MVGNDDRVVERVEGVLEQPPLAQHVFEELDVLDPDRELPAEFDGEIEARLIVHRLGGCALDHQGAERAAPAPERRDENRFDRAVISAKDLGALQP